MLSLAKLPKEKATRLSHTQPLAECILSIHILDEPPLCYQQLERLRHEEGHSSDLDAICLLKHKQRE